MKKYNVLASTLTVVCAVAAFMLSSTQAQAQLLPNGVYIIEANNPPSAGLCLADPGSSKAKFTDMEMLAVNGNTNFEWTLVNLGSNIVELTNVASGLALDVSGDSKAPEALVDQYPFDGGANQLWYLSGIGNGTFVLENVNSGLALDVVGGSQNPGTKVDQYPYGGKLWQQWLIKSAGD